MPNWVSNALKAVGSREQIERFQSTIASEHSPFDFQKIMPMPESLHIISGSCTGIAMIAYALLVNDDHTMKEVQEYLINKEGEKVYVRNKHEADALFSKWDKAILATPKDAIDYSEYPKNDFAVYSEYGRVYIQNIREYGTPTWYEWAKENWWTKWNASNVMVGEIAPFKDDLVALSISYDTAWSIPGGILEEIAKKFPEVNFTGCWNIEYEWIDHFWTAKGEDIHVISEDNETELQAACTTMGVDFKEYLATRNSEDNLA